jgi:hypothetical protein
MIFENYKEKFFKQNKIEDIKNIYVFDNSFYEKLIRGNEKLTYYPSEDYIRHLIEKFDFLYKVLENRVSFAEKMYTVMMLELKYIRLKSLSKDSINWFIIENVNREPLSMEGVLFDYSYNNKNNYWTKIVDNIFYEYMFLFAECLFVDYNNYCNNISNDEEYIFIKKWSKKYMAFIESIKDKDNKFSEKYNNYNNIESFYEDIKDVWF